MNLDEYASDDDPYRGIWGRLGYLITRQGVDAAIREARNKDGTWKAATWMQLRIRDKEFKMSLSDIERENWVMALELASEHVQKQFIEKETDDKLLSELATAVAEQETVDTDLLGSINQRRIELRK